MPPGRRPNSQNADEEKTDGVYAARGRRAPNGPQLAKACYGAVIIHQFSAPFERP